MSLTLVCVTTYDCCWLIIWQSGHMAKRADDPPYNGGRAVRVGKNVLFALGAGRNAWRHQWNNRTTSTPLVRSCGSHRLKVCLGWDPPPQLTGQRGGTLLPVNKYSIIPLGLPRMPSADQLITMCSAASTYSHIQQFHKSNVSRSVCDIKPESPPFNRLRLVEPTPQSWQPLPLTMACMQYWSAIIATHQIDVEARPIAHSTDTVCFVGCLVMFSPPSNAEAMGALYYIHVMSQHIWLI